MNAARLVAELFLPLPADCPPPELWEPAGPGMAWELTMGEAVAFISNERTAREAFRLLQPLAAPPATLQPSDRAGLEALLASLRVESGCNSELQPIPANAKNKSRARISWRSIFRI